jgi:NAD(P)-dependent dehydrogenase (short-subunit alcohol dehydrogenase family)
MTDKASRKKRPRDPNQLAKSIVDIAPGEGEIDTAILSPGTGRIVAEQIPMHRLGEPEEVAKAIYFLCSDQASYVNGTELHINGGQHV